MDKKRWVIASIIVAIVVTLMESVFHGYFMRGLYEATATLWRPYPEMSKLTPYGWLSTLFVSFILFYIYHKGYEGKGSALAEGLRFGLFIGLFTAVPMAVWTYIVMPVPMSIAFWWFVIAMIDMLVAGVLIGAIYKRKTA